MISLGEGRATGRSRDLGRGVSAPGRVDVKVVRALFRSIGLSRRRAHARSRFPERHLVTSSMTDCAIARADLRSARADERVFF